MLLSDTSGVLKKARRFRRAFYFVYAAFPYGQQDSTGGGPLLKI